MTVFAQKPNEANLIFENIISQNFLEDYLGKISSNLAAGSSIFDLGIYIFGMVIYALFVWHFYRVISRREIIPIDYDKHSEAGKLSATRIGFFVAGHIFLFPIIILVWFLVYSLFMFVLAKDMPIGVVLLISMSVIGAIRVTSYYKEDLAKDVGKLLPFALLGVFLTSSAFFTNTSSFFSIDEFQQRLQEMPQFFGKMVEFIVFVFILESILRIGFVIKRKIIPASGEILEEKIEDEIENKIRYSTKIIEKNQEEIKNHFSKEIEKLN